MKRPILHQMTVGARPGDAITDQALMMRRWLREAGYESELYADSIHPELARTIRPARRYRPSAGERHLIFHHSTGSDVADMLSRLPVRLLLVYHNITPARFFADGHPALSQEMARGERQLRALRPQSALALGVSPFNREALIEAGFARTDLLPLALRESDYGLLPTGTATMPAHGAPPTLLFVGRLAPNKKQEDLIKLLYYLRRSEPEARLRLVGEPWLADYAAWLAAFARDLGLGEAVDFCGHLPHDGMVAAYREADLYLSMSEHEGFGKPLIESMLCELPVLAFAAGGVPSTLGGAGVLFHEKRFPALAEVARWLMQDQAARGRILARQRERVRLFLEPHVREHFLRLIARLAEGYPS